MTDTLSKTILVVDDELHVAEILTMAFRRRGYDVRVARHGQAGFDAAQDNPPLVGIVDYQMPGMDGLELAERMAAEPRTASVPLVLLTARGHLVDQDRLERTAVRRIVAKPFSTRELTALVESIVHGDAQGAAA